MMISNFGGIRRMRRELGLKAKLDAGWAGRVSLEAEVFIENPNDVCGEAFSGEKVFPFLQGDFERRTLIMAGRFHAPLGPVLSKPVNKKRNGFFDWGTRRIAQHSTCLGNIRTG